MADIPPDPAADSWIARNWRPLCAVVYLITCLTDFVIMPTWTQWENARTPATMAAELAVKFTPASQIPALTALRQPVTWDPLTLRQNGFFHVTFMAILGVSAWSRGKEKQLRLKLAAMRLGDRPAAPSGEQG